MSYHQWTAKDIEDMTELQLNAMIEKIVVNHPRLQTSIGGGGTPAEKIKFLKEWFNVSKVSTSKEKKKGQQS